MRGRGRARRGPALATTYSLDGFDNKLDYFCDHELTKILARTSGFAKPLFGSYQNTLYRNL